MNFSLEYMRQIREEMRWLSCGGGGGPYSNHPPSCLCNVCQLAREQTHKAASNPSEHYERRTTEDGVIIQGPPS